MKKVLQVFLGVLTAIGGFVDIGDLVANAVVGARFGLSLAWVVLVGVVGICLFADMSGRVAAVTRRGTFDLVRERLGPRVGLINLSASMLVTFLTLAAEVGGVALALELATSVSYLLFVPLVAFLVWLVIWRLPFEQMERAFGLAGLALLVFAVGLWQLGPDWSGLLHDATHPTVPHGEGHPTYWFYAIALFGAAMTPYEVFFFSSGAVEEGWTKKDLGLERVNVYLGFPLGGALSIAIAATTAVVLLPQGISVDHLDQVALPTVLALGKVGLAFLIVGFVAATFGAALETALSTGYSISQYLGWQWGKHVAPRNASRFHAVVLMSIITGSMLILTTLDPVKVTEYSLIFSAVALPLTYFPILVVANDRDYMGDEVNGRVVNALASGYLVLLTVVSVAAIPLMLATKAGQ
ncbi:MAG: natural resistance-associated macrophage protein [Frankiales bacterium]|nr:natural resistance-associated macrophage protein [Frankiales bacterium]